MKYPFKNLVFKGGGVLGVAYQGAYEVLHEQKILPAIEKVCGTSTGAISALLIGLGYSPKESREVLIHLDFKSLQDGGWTGIFRLFKQYGWFKGDAFLNLFKTLCAEKTGNPAITFRDLHKKDRIQVFFTGTNISKLNSQVFCYEHTPDLPLAEAARMSISVPYYFASCTYQGDIFVDGGVLEDYAISLFDRADRTTSKAETLGFYLNYHTKPIKIHNFISFVEGMLHTQSNQQLNALQEHPEDLARTVFIDTLGISVLDFKLNQEQKLKLMEQGRKATETYLEKYT